MQEKKKLLRIILQMDWAYRLHGEDTLIPLAENGPVFCVGPEQGFSLTHISIKNTYGNNDYSRS